MNCCGRAIGIGGQERRGLVCANIGHVHATVGADQPLRGLGDEHVLLAHHALGLAQGQLHHSWIAAILAGEASRGRGGLYRTEWNCATFSLGYDLVFDHQDVARVQTQAAESECVHYKVRDRIAGKNLTNAEDRKYAEFADVERSRTRQTAFCHCASSVALNAHERSSRCALVLPSRCNNKSSSCGLSMSRPMPGISRITSSLPVMRIASQCGRKLSFPKRRGMSDAGRRRIQLLPRRSYAGTKTAPSAGAASRTRCSSLLVISGMSPGTTTVVS